MTRYLVTKVETWEFDADSEDVARDWAALSEPDTVDVQVEVLPDLTTTQ